MTRHVLILSLALILIGLGITAYKARELNYPLQPGKSVSTWNLELSLSFVATGEPARLELFLPRETRSFRVRGQDFVSDQFGMTFDEIPDGPFVSDQRAAVFSARQPRGTQFLYYRAEIEKLAQGFVEELPAPNLDKLKSRIHVRDLKERDQVAAFGLIDSIRPQSADQETFIKGILEALRAPAPNSNASALLSSEASPKERSRVVAMVLRVAEVAARPVHGIVLGASSRHVPIVHGIEVWEGGTWRIYDPTVEGGEMDRNFLPWWRGEQSLARIDGGRNLNYSLAVDQHQVSAAARAVGQGEAQDDAFANLSLYNLPVTTQLVYRVLLVLPIGALLLVFLRQFIGVATFGTFMPVLIGLAFRETGLVWGMVLFGFVLLAGLSFRFYFEKLQLHLVPRLAAVLVIVVFVMTALSVVTERFQLGLGLSVALFPIVILTMTIERMSITWEELGAADALKQALGSFMVAALAHAVMTIFIVEHLFFTFPELLFVLLGVILMCGRYTGPRLVEVYRFRDLMKEQR